MVPFAAQLRVGLVVGGLAVAYEVQCLAEGGFDIGVRELGGGQQLVCAGQLAADLGLFLGGDVLGHAAVERAVGESAAVAFEFGDACLLPLGERVSLLLLGFQFGEELAAQGFDAFRFELDVCIESAHGVFDRLDGQKGQVAAVATVTGHAEEVRVDSAGFAFGVGDAQPRAAAGTEHAAFEVVVVGAVALTGGVVRVEHGLDALEQRRTDQRLMPAWVLGALVGDDADVVGVA